MDITFRPLHGQSETMIASPAFWPTGCLFFEAGETKRIDDPDAFDALLRNPNFIDADLGRNPYFTCTCGASIASHDVDPAEHDLYATNLDGCSEHATNVEVPIELPADAADTVYDDEVDAPDPSELS
jgi:hypothetical protein